MQIHVHHHAVPDEALTQRLDWLRVQLETLMATLDEVLTAVRAESGQIDSIATLLAQLHEQVKGVTAGTLPPDVQAKVDAIFEAAGGNAKKLADAINANADAPPSPAPSSTPAPDSFGQAPTA